MTILSKILDDTDKVKRATDAGKNMHHRLQGVRIAKEAISGDDVLVQKIVRSPDLCRMFDGLSRVEVPIAGTVYGRFVSRRIDRLRIDNATKTVDVLDYKTDTDKTIFYDKYLAQVREYMALVSKLYPGHRINGYILWTHDFELEQVV